MWHTQPFVRFRLMTLRVHGTGGLGPGPQGRTISLGQPGCRMCRTIKQRRHIALFNLLPALIKGFKLLFPCPAIPGRKVHVRAAFMDIAGNQPRNRRDPAVPWPDSLIGVTVVTGPPQDGTHRSRGRNLRLDRRIRPIHRHKLNRQKHKDNPGNRPFRHNSAVFHVNHPFCLRCWSTNTPYRLPAVKIPFFIADIPTGQT